MRSRAGPGKQAELMWMLGSFVVIQLLLGFAIDRAWMEVRDPEFAARLKRLANCTQQNLDRPLILVLGSSRTNMGLRAGDLSRPPDAPLIFNFAIPGSGPIFQHVTMRRLLAAGVRPARVIVEIMPTSLSCRGGRAPNEEGLLDSARLDASEVVGVYRYYHRPYRLSVRWATGRLLPAWRHQAGLCDVIGLGDGGKSSAGSETWLDEYGWRRPLAAPVTKDQLAKNMQRAMGQYVQALNDGTLAAGPLHAFRDLLDLCKQSAIPVAVVIPPEGSMFRDNELDYSAIETAIRRAVRDSGSRLYDARAWIDDAGFWDGHHLTVEGAGQFTERFRREILVPELARTGSPEMPIAALRTGR
jgi:hypothetical protein